MARVEYGAVIVDAKPLRNKIDENRIKSKPVLPMLRTINIARWVAMLTASACLVGHAAMPDEISLPPFAFYQVPTPAAGPCVISAGPDGATWFIETFAAKIGRIDPATNHIDEYPIPWSADSLITPLPIVPLPSLLTPLPCALQPGADGKMYFANGFRNQIGSIDPGTKAFEMYQAPAILGNGVPFNDITPGSDNAIWFTQTTAGTAGRFDLVTKTFTNIPVPTPSSLPIGIYGASDGGVWFTEAASGKIGRIDETTFSVTEYPTPTVASVPFVIRAETESRYLWFTEIAAGKIGRVDMQTKTIVEYAIPAVAPAPVATCTSSTGDVYFSQLSIDAFGKIVPQTGQITEIAIPYSVASATVELSCGPGNAVWLVQTIADRIVRYSLE